MRTRGDRARGGGTALAGRGGHVRATFFFFFFCNRRERKTPKINTRTTRSPFPNRRKQKTANKFFRQCACQLTQTQSIPRVFLLVGNVMSGYGTGMEYGRVVQRVKVSVGKGGGVSLRVAHGWAQWRAIDTIKFDRAFFRFIDKL